MNVDRLYIKHFHRQDPRHITIIWWLFFAGLLLALWGIYIILPDVPFQQEVIYTIGIIGLWRYGWKAIHLFRGLYYQYVRYPIIASLAEMTHKPSEVLVVIPCYRTTPEISSPVFKALIDEIGNFGVACRKYKIIQHATHLNFIMTIF